MTREPGAVAPRHLTAHGQFWPAYPRRPTCDRREQDRQPRSRSRTARPIGVAMGIIVERHKMSECDAFQTLASVSQRANRKLRNVSSAPAASGAARCGDARDLEAARR